MSQRRRGSAQGERGCKPAARIVFARIERAIRAAANYRLMRARGATVRKTIDLVIATFCIARGHILLHDDRDFDAMADHLLLRVM